jgi:hypothetical protein
MFHKFPFHLAETAANKQLCRLVVSTQALQPAKFQPQAVRETTKACSWREMVTSEASKQAPLEKLHFQILDSRVLQLAADFSLVKDLRSFILFV